MPSPRLTIPPALAIATCSAVTAGLLLGVPATASAVPPPAFTWEAQEPLAVGEPPVSMTTAASDTGGATVAYQQFVSPAAGYAIVAHTWTGNAWGNANLLSATGISSIGPEVSMNAANDACVLWQEFQDGTFAVRCTRDGRWEGFIDSVVTPDLPGGSHAISLADNGTAAAVVAAYIEVAPGDYRQTLVAKVRSVDGLWSAPAVIEALPQFASASDLSVEGLADGTFVAVWRGSGTAIRSAVYSPFTGSWGPSSQLFDEGFVADLTLLRGGGAITLAWLREDPVVAVRNIRAMNYTELGWTAPRTAANSVGDVVNDVTFVPNSDGGFAVSYLAGTAPTAPVQLIVVPTTGAPGIQGAASPDSRQLWGLDLGVTAAGDYVVVLDRGRMQEGTPGRGLYALPVSAAGGVVEAASSATLITPLVRETFADIAAVPVGAGLSVLSVRQDRLSATVGTAQVVPDAPTRLRGTSTRPGVIRLAWRPPVQGADEYRVQVRGASGGWRDAGTSASPRLAYRGDPGAAYRFRVRAVLGGVASPWSDVARVRAAR